MTEEKMEEAVDVLINDLDEKSMKSMGVIMGQMKSIYDGLYDGKFVSQLVRKKLQ